MFFINSVFCYFIVLVVCSKIMNHTFEMFPMIKTILIPIIAFFVYISHASAELGHSWKTLKSQTQGWSLSYPDSLFQYGGFIPDAFLEAKIKGQIKWQSRFEPFKTQEKLNKTGISFTVSKIGAHIGYFLLPDLEKNSYKKYQRFVRTGSTSVNVRREDDTYLINGETHLGMNFQDKLIFSDDKIYVLKIEYPRVITQDTKNILSKIVVSFKTISTDFRTCQNKCIVSKKGCKLGQLLPWCETHNKKCDVKCYKRVKKKTSRRKK